MSSKEVEVEITKEIAPFAPEEELGVYKVSRWTFRQKQTAVMKASTVLDADKGLIEMDLIEFQVQQILSCTVPPEGHEWNVERVNKFDPDVGDALLTACRKVNGVTLSEKKGFLRPSDAAKDTPG